MKRLYAKADRIVLLTQAGLRIHTEEWGFPASRCCVIPNPLDDVCFSIDSTHANLREPGLLVAIGRLVPQKGFEDLIDAVAGQLRDRPIRVAICGEGPLRPKLESRIRSLGLSDRIALIGQVSDVRYWLDRAAVFVLSSHHEGFPNIVTEAMARGCPIVSTDCPTGPNEMLEHEHSGLLVPVGDPVALGQAMRRMLDNPILATNCALAARTMAEQWAIERIAPMWIVS